MSVTGIRKFTPLAGTVLFRAAGGATLFLAVLSQGFNGKGDESEDDEGDDDIRNDGCKHADLTEIEGLQSG